VQLADPVAQRPPQVVSAEFEQAARPPFGWPEVTWVQVPEALSQVWHSPVHVAGQQMPSAAQ
jgi:hypothetical protein